MFETESVRSCLVQKFLLGGGGGSPLVLPVATSLITYEFLLKLNIFEILLTFKIAEIFNPLVPGVH